MKKRLTSCALALPSLFIAEIGQAETIHNDTMVVTAAGFDQSIKQAPASISVITQEQLQQKQVNNLADALNDIEGIDVRATTGKTGSLSISLRGMPSEYTLILLDGRRQNAGKGVMPNGFQSVETNFLPPMAAIERIEVIRGPMSTLYGSDAMGGVINIITKKMPQQWSTNLNLASTLQQHSRAGNSQNLNLYSAGQLIEDKLGLALRASVYHREESKLIASNHSDVNVSTMGPSPVEADNYVFGGKLTYQFNPDNHLWFDLDFAKQKYDNSKEQIGTIWNKKQQGWGGYKDTMRFNRQQFALGHEGLFDNGIRVQSSLMYNQTETIGRAIPSSAVPKDSPRANQDRELEASNIIFDNKWVMPLFDVHKLTLGGQYWNAKLRDGLVSHRYKQNSGSLFIEDEWNILDNLALTLGGRYEQHQTFSGHFSPRSYLVWNVSDDWTVKGGVGRGYKTPDLTELHDGINGITRQGRVVTLGNPKLKPEVSTNSEIGLYYENSQRILANLTYFNNRFSDKIENVNVANCAAQAVAGCVTISDFVTTQKNFSRPVNLDKAKTQGLEFNSEVPFFDVLSLRLNYTYTHSEQLSGDSKGKALSYVPEHMANARLNWYATDKLTTWVSLRYHGSADRFNQNYAKLSSQQRGEYDITGNKLKGYTLFDLGARYIVNDNVSLNFVVYNLFDKDFLKYKKFTYKEEGNDLTDYANAYVSGARGNPGGIDEGRRFWVSANITF